MHKWVRSRVIFFLAGVVSPAFAATTDIAQLPLGMMNVVEPNMILGIDDSGSMDTEVLLTSNDGALWYNSTSGKAGFTGWNSSDVYSATNYAPNYNSAGGTSSTWLKYEYLFPNSSRKYVDTAAAGEGYAAPFIPSYAYLRDYEYNPLYYNPNTTYVPWAADYYSGTTTTYSNSVPTAARIHPTESPTVTYDLTNTLTNGTSGWTFRFYTGMVIPGSTISGIKNGSTSITTDVTVGTSSGYTNSYYDITIPYYPATYWVKDATCTNGAPACATAPDGSLLRRYEIKSSNTFPSGRSYAAEMQNFANWFTYYRKRRLMLSSAMSAVLPQLTNLRMGARWMDSSNVASMVDLNSTTPATNYQYLLGLIYRVFGAGGTPTRTLLKAIGDLYKNDSSETYIQYACQRNSIMIVTDGFADASTTTPPAYSSSPWFTSAPYTTTYSGTLADLAASYYSNTLGSSSFTAGRVPYDPNATSPSADKNPNLHMNTYGMTLGAQGTIFGTGSNQDKDPYTYAPTWPNPNVAHSPTAVDDLYHATINGRGKMLLATDSVSATTSIKSIIADLLNKSGAGGAISVSNINIQPGDNTAYIASFNASSWYGDLVAAPIDLTTGNTSASSSLWSFQATLDALSWTTRKFASYTGSSGAIFPDGLSSTQTALLNSPSATDNLTVANWLKGDRSNEGTLYRTRTHVLGDLVDAEPVMVNNKRSWSITTDSTYTTFGQTIAGRKSVVYQGGNDGMLHAIDASNGGELWAYIPSLVLAKLNSLSQKTYNHTFTVDGTPTVRDVNSSGTWKTLLVAGLRAGGNGYYALDVTNPAATSSADLASKVKWEFPNASTSSSVTNNVGLSYGQPLITNTAAGYVVMVSSGYNNGGDYAGHMFVLNPDTGAVIRDIPTGYGTSLSPAGLAHLSAYSSDGITASAVYAGDLNGNVFKFDISDPNPANWSVARIALLQDGSGAAQPITQSVEVGQVNSKTAIFVGTGRSLATSDFSSTQIQSVYAFLDDGTVYTGTSSPRSVLVPQTVTVNADGTRTITKNTVNYSTQKGWYFDLPGGEGVTSDMQLAFGTLVLNSNAPSTTACSSNSYQYQVDEGSGGQLDNSYFATGITPWAGRSLGSNLTSRPVVAVLSNGTVISFSHGSDNSVISLALLGKGATAMHKIFWREVRN
ncbi:pilus assembly protein [Pseudomonas batumici]|nr:PilC/PilY family type IV pilus protein [Pseudomonas batumici]